MKAFANPPLSIVLLMIAVAWIFPILAGAQDPKSILITDITGQKEKIESPIFEYSDNHRNNYPEHFEVITPGSPGKSSWIHFSQIKTATFEQTKKEPKIAVVTESGKTLSGIFSDPDLKISGEGELGKATYDLGKIRSIEFILFSKYENNKEVPINRQAASMEWKKSQKTKPGSRVMNIIDGNTTIKAENLQIRDCYHTSKQGMMVYFGRIFRDHHWSDIVTVQRGASQVDVSLKDLESLEITGRKVDNRPEIILMRKDGSNYMVILLMRTSGGEKDYGAVEPDDMIVWNSEHGFEGISLFPLRPMTLKVQR